MSNYHKPTPVQIGICEKYQSKIIPYSENEMVAVALESIGKQPIYGTRIQKKNDNNVTWFFHCGEYSDDEGFYKPIHVIHLRDFIPKVENYLCLDYGFKIIVDANGYEDVWRDV